MKYNQEFKLMVIDPNGFCGMGNNDKSLIDTVHEYNKTHRKILHRRKMDGMFGLELASEGKIVIMNNYDAYEDITTSTIYMPDEINKTMEDYAGIAYEFIEGFEQVSIEYDIHKENGVFSSKSKVRTGENARDIFLEHIKSMREEHQKRLELTI